MSWGLLAAPGHLFRSWCKRRHRALEFRAFLDQVEAAVPPDLDVHLVLDAAAAHKTRLVHDWLVKRSRFHLHVTPTSASWLDLVERWFALLTRRRLRRGVFTSTGELEDAIRAHIASTNAHPKCSRAALSGGRGAAGRGCAHAGWPATRPTPAGRRSARSCAAAASAR